MLSYCYDKCQEQNALTQMKESLYKQCDDFDFDKKNVPFSWWVVGWCDGSG